MAGAIPTVLGRVCCAGGVFVAQGRLAVRIERMPQLARLSTGRNNGDNSWSLTLDQLEDLTYQGDLEEAVAGGRDELSGEEKGE